MELLINADIFAPRPGGRGQVLVAGDRVVWMGEEVPELPAALGATVHDLEGRRLIPGLVDGHVHLTGGGGEDGFGSRVPPVPLSAFTRSGTTCVVGLLGTDDTTRGTASLVATTRGLAEQGLGAYCLTGGYHLPPTTLTGSVRTDLVHIDCIVGVGEIAISDHRSSQPTLDELLRVASEAYVGGMLAKKAGVVHLHLGDGRRGLELVRQAIQQSELPARVFHPTHVNRREALLDEALALADRGSCIDITAFEVAEGDGSVSAVDALRKYLDRGLPPERVTVSSDCGGSLPVFDADGSLVCCGVGAPNALSAALEELLGAGLALEDVLPAFTENVAGVFRLKGHGRIEVGGRADLVVLGSDHAIRDVMVAGNWHVREGRSLVRGRFEAETTEEEKRHG